MKRLLAFFIVALAPSFGLAFEGENLLVSMPPGYKVDFQKSQGNSQITEMVPAGETVNNWTEMLTVQVFNGLKDVTPEQFRDRLAQDWKQACANSLLLPIASATEKGYPIAFWHLFCPLNTQTGKPETAFMKGIRGRDSFYLVQEAFRSEPSKDQVVTWTKFLKNVGVCDTRVAERACPPGIK